MTQSRGKCCSHVIEGMALLSLDGGAGTAALIAVNDVAQMAGDTLLDIEDEMQVVGHQLLGNHLDGRVMTGNLPQLVKDGASQGAGMYLGRDVLTIASDTGQQRSPAIHYQEQSRQGAAARCSTLTASNVKRWPLKKTTRGRAITAPPWPSILILCGYEKLLFFH